MCYAQLLSPFAVRCWRLMEVTRAGKRVPAKQTAEHEKFKAPKSSASNKGYSIVRLCFKASATYAT